MTNVHRVRKGIIIGANILSFAILNELQLAGIKVEHIVLPEKELSQKAGEPEEVFITCCTPCPVTFITYR